MKRCSRLVIVLLPVASVACAANFHDYVASVASDKFACPKEQIALTPANPEGYEEAYDAQGCGHHATFAGRCSVGMCSSQMLRSPQARAAAEQGSRSSEGSRSGQSSSLTSLQLANRCPHTVKLFVGMDPRSSGGTSTSISSNEIVNFPMGEGDKLWIVDDSGRPLGSTKASGEPFEHVKILETCSGFAPE